MTDRTDKSAIIVWFRKDLRLADNLALSAAASSGRPVIALYIREPEGAGTGPLGAAQAWWLHHSLVALSTALARHHLPLVLRSGEAQAVLDELIAETGAEAVYWNRRYDPPGMGIDAPIKAALGNRGIAVKSFAGQLLHEPSQLKTAQGNSYRVFTPFWRGLQAAGEPPEPLEAPNSISVYGHGRALASENIDDWSLLPQRPNWAKGFEEVWTPGEAGAQEKLTRFLKRGLSQYRSGRDFPGQPAVSMLSPHLAMGEITPATLWHAVSRRDADSENVAKFRQEVGWRDFSYHLLFHFHDLASRNWNDRFDSFEWQDDDALFTAWTRGQTGYPIVDAGMRQLWQHGYIHNRVRMIVASFLIKDLRIDWRRGEAWFRDTLVDADPASNAASWQWVAGSGADAAPFFRIFNPMLQGEKFDGDGAYVRQFVPELSRLDNRYIHRPFECPAPALKAAGVELGRDYPRPIVDHGQARDLALTAYKETAG